MPDQHVLCYSTVDAHDLALRLAAAVRSGAPPLQVMLVADDEKLPVETIRDCASLIFGLTPAAVAEDSPGRQALALALRYHKPIVPVLLDSAARLPAILEPRKPIAVTTFERGLTQLRTRLQQLATPKGRVQILNERLADAERDLRQEHEPPRQARIRDEIALLQQQIEQQQRVMDDPQRAAKRATIDVERQIERERYTGPLPIETEADQSPGLEAELSAPDIETWLRSLDAEGRLGLRDAPDELLDQARQKTLGIPRAIELLAAILAADRSASLPALLGEIPALPPAKLIEWLLAEVFARLDPSAQEVIQALAIYNRPVTPNAVDFLLLPFLPGFKSAPTLKLLLAFRLVRSHGDRYRLHSIDREVALSRIPRGETADRGAKGQPRFTQYALLQRGAEYCKQSRLPEKSWKALDDLAPQLAEFELRVASEDDEAAATLLLTIGPTLSVFGQQRLLIRLNEQLQDKINDYRLSLLVIDQLAAAYHSLGEHETALGYYKRSLGLAREHNDRAGEGIGLGNLGQYWLIAGQPVRAMEQLKQALSIARETKDLHATQSRLLGLGICAKEIGATQQALDYDEQALAIARRLGDKGSESVILGNLGLCYGDLGETGKALDLLKQAQAVARSAGARSSEGTMLVNQAIILIDEERYAEAEQQTLQSAQIAQGIASPRLAGFSSRFLALARLLSNDLPGARSAAEAALLHQSPEHTSNVLVLLGLIALLQHDHDEARHRLTAAIQAADALLNDTPELFKALDAKALALTGLVPIDGMQHIPDAIAAFHTARTINHDAGIVGRVLRLLDALATTDSAGLLLEVRAAASGA